MAWVTPSLQAVITSVVRAFNAELPGADAALARNNLAPSAKVFGAGLHGVHVFADYAARQAFVLTCDADNLDRHGAQMKPPVPRKQTSFAGGPVTVTSVAGATVPSGATLLGAASGLQYRVTVGAVIPPAGSAAISVQAVISGSDGNIDPAGALVAGAGVSGLVTAEAGTDGVTGGADAEADDLYRRRLLFARAFPDHAGALPDYKRYATAVAGCTRVFIDQGGLGRSTLILYPLFDALPDSGIGSPGDLLRVANEIALRRAGGTLVAVRAPTPVAVPITITGLAPATPEVRLAAEQEIRYAFARNSRVSGLSESHPSMDFLATPATFSRSWIWQAVANATGEERHIVTLPAADIVLAPGEMAVPGVVTWA